MNPQKPTPEEQRLIDKELSRKAFEKRMALIKTLQGKLKKEYPLAFNPSEPKPLAIGVHKDLFAAYPDYPKKLIREFLARWVKHPAYCKAMVIGANRYALDGSPQGTVTAAILETRKSQPS